MKYLISVLTFTVGLISALSAAAQQSVTKINDVDQRLPSIEKKIILQEITNLLDRSASLAAQLMLEKEANTNVSKRLDAVNEYWKNWCGQSPGCSTVPLPRSD